MAAKELDEWTRAAERAEMQIRLKARIARLLEARERTARRVAAAGSGRTGSGLHSQAESRHRGSPARSHFAAGASRIPDTDS